jgi:cytochrome c oxidase subunit 3
MEMTMTTGEEQLRKSKSAKLILLFAMVSMTMMFAGLTSAFVVSKSRADWLKNFELPTAFYYSTAVIIGCSVTFYLAKKAIQKDNRSATTALLLGTLALGVLVVVNTPCKISIVIPKKTENINEIR